MPVRAGSNEILQQSRRMEMQVGERREAMKLSIVIVCWNDRELIKNCLQSIYTGTRKTDFEVIVSDNGSTDGSVEFIRENFPKTRVIENRANLGYAKGNNAGIRSSVGKYVLTLHPDTVVDDGALDKWVRFADSYEQAGGFGCQILNPDGSFQGGPRSFPTVPRYWMDALGLQPLVRLYKAAASGKYFGGREDFERQIDSQADCCIMFRNDLLKRLGGFDEAFFYRYGAADLCRRLWDAGFPVLYSPDVTVTHVGGGSVKRCLVRFKIEKYRSRYKYFHKHFGARGAMRCRRVTLVGIRIRQFGYTVLNFIKPREAVSKRLELFRVVAQWNVRANPMNLMENREEVSVGTD